MLRRRKSQRFLQLWTTFQLIPRLSEGADLPCTAYAPLFPDALLNDFELAHHVHKHDFFLTVHEGGEAAH
jgi:hypothetical protein